MIIRDEISLNTIKLVFLSKIIHMMTMVEMSMNKYINKSQLDFSI